MEISIVELMKELMNVQEKMIQKFLIEWHETHSCEPTKKDYREWCRILLIKDYLEKCYE